MIRRDAGEDWLLIAQTDHAALSAQLAAHVGNARFAKASAFEAIALHDAGWPLHDDEPTLNSQQIPLDVFETPREIALKVWAASADRAAAVDPYAGLLVSLHSLSLSIHATSAPPKKTEKFDVQKMHEQFEVNKFQHREVERQEQLRRRLGFNTKLHLKHGIAEAHASKEDDQLRFDFHLLQAMDLMSLCLCCTELPQKESNDVLTSVTGKSIRFKFERDNLGRLRVDPWPFDVDRMELNVPCRRIRAMKFDSLEQFRLVYRGAPTDFLTVTVAGRL